MENDQRHLLRDVGAVLDLDADVHADVGFFEAVFLDEGALKILTNLFGLVIGPGLAVNEVNDFTSGLRLIRLLGHSLQAASG